MRHTEKISVIALVLLINWAQGQSPLQNEPLDVYELLHGNHKNSGPLGDEKQEHALITAGKGNANPSNDLSLEWRLPRNVLPGHYEVRIAPVLDDGQEAIAERWFTQGEVNIRLHVQQQTNQIVLHAKNLTIQEIEVRILETTIPVIDYDIVEHDFLKINLSQPLEQSQTYTLHIKFQSFISTELNGLYRSSYTNPENGKTVWLATTQMEALHARQMFPCFDEPGIKSVFNFTIARMPKYVALFNSESTGVAPGPIDGWEWESYALTPVMSTYLLAVVISEFKFTEAPDELYPGKKIRTYAPEHYIQQDAGIYAAENVAKVLSYFGTYFNHEYPMTKMDSVAVPDFWFGAMENYGLNIYRETALLVFPGVSLESERWSISSVIAHELAHQWFGNLVSPAWWTHIWLNEGFATYFAAIGANHTNPEYEPTKRYLNDAVQRSMEFAADPSYAHSVKIGEEEWKTRDPMAWFGRMIYEQAGSLIRMIDGFLTTPALTLGLQQYLLTNQYNAAEQDFLFHQLDMVAKTFQKIPTDLTMKDIMDTWTLKPGFPLVRVSRASADRIYVSQEKFTNNMGAMPEWDEGKVDANNELWHIPISVATKSTPNFDPGAEQWLDKDIAMTSWEINAEEWIILNAGATGYFRVLYDVPLTNLIKAQLDSDHSVIEDLTRSQLMDDYFTSGYQKYISLARALELTSYLGKESEIVVWNTVLKHLRKPLNLLPSGGGAFYSNFRNYLLPKIKEAFTALGGITEQFEERAGMPILRHQQFADWTCALEDDECQNFSVNKVTEWKDTGSNTIPRDIQQIVYCAAVAKGTDDIFQFIKGQYDDEATSTVQQSRLLNALACTTDSGNARELLDGSLTSDYYRNTADASRILGRLAMTTLGRSAVLQFIREKATEIRDHFGNAGSIATVYSTAATYASTSTELQDLESIAEEIADVIEDVKPSIDQSLATVRANIAWMTDFADAFQSFFAANKH